MMDNLSTLVYKGLQSYYTSLDTNFLQILCKGHCQGQKRTYTVFPPLFPYSKPIDWTLLAYKIYRNLVLGPYYISYLKKKLHVITDLLSFYLLFFLKSVFKSGLDFRKSGLEGSNGKNKGTST